MRTWIIRLATCVIVALGCGNVAFAAETVDELHIDLNSLIDSAARTKVQFAVNIPHAVSAAERGTWTRRGSSSTWTYTARIATAVSLSFHAAAVTLPPSAVLTVSGGRATVRYVARDISRGGLWSRPLPGEQISFSLTVNSSEVSRVRFQIESLQAGYRSLGQGVPDHPHYLRIQKDSAAGCTENFQCHVTSANQGSGHATVALIIGNLYQCSGTLLNNTSGNGATYILTARHCQTGQFGGGNPSAASSVGVYWDAVTPCGSSLGSLYDISKVSQGGATTIFEQQDLWLIQLDTPPAASDAYFAGWDAGGTSINGGYTVHLALGEGQQYVGWGGNDILEQIPAATLGAAFDSTFWGVVNSVGNLGSGGSGSALFSPNNQVVGSASLAQLPDGQDSAGICPNGTVTPSASTATALFTALSGSWTSTADRTSSTGSKTLQSILDPGDTGVTQLAGVATIPITITSSSSATTILPISGDPITLSWNVLGASSCTASGGTSGDGWTGPQPASGSLVLTNTSSATSTYNLTCLIGQQLGIGSVVVAWDYIAPDIALTGGSEGPITLGFTWGLSWQSNVKPCVASGGFPGDGWAGPQPASGSFPAVITQTGLAVYTLNCGSGTDTATNSVGLYGVAPNVTLVTSTPQVKVGTPIELSSVVYSAGNACTPSGGSGNDSWLSIGQNGSGSVIETVPGTYTFTLTCNGGGQSASSSQTVVVTSGAPTISLSAANAQQQVGTTALNLLWTSDFDGCSIDFTSNSGLRQTFVLIGEGTAGAASYTEQSPGMVTYTLDCSGPPQSQSTTINWVGGASPVALSSSTTRWASDVSYPVIWNSSAGPCSASGGSAGDGWSGAKAQSGSQSVTESKPGIYVFALTCGASGATTTSNLVVQVPIPLIQMHSNSGVSPGNPEPHTSIVWSSTVGPCTYLDGSSANPTGVSVPPVGSAIPSAAMSGIYVFNLQCGSGASTLYDAVAVAVAVALPPTLSVSVTSAVVDSPITVTWNSPGGICYAEGGTARLPWFGTLPGNGSGSLIVTSTSAGTVTYGIQCNGLTATATVNYTAVPATSAEVPKPSVTISSADSQQTTGQSVTLTWHSQNANSCLASGGISGDGWSGMLPAAGSVIITEANAGMVNYSITCSGAPPAATAVTSVVFVTASAATTSTASGGSSHGGGAIDPPFLAFLATLFGMSLRRHRKRV